MDIGIHSFAAIFPDPATGALPSAADRMADVLEEIELAERVGLDFFGIGEHHRAEFLDSTPAVILAVAAARTSRIRLTSAVTVLSAADPVRVFQEFATLDLISRGHANEVLGGISRIAFQMTSAASETAAMIRSIRGHPRDARSMRTPWGRSAESL